LWPDLTSLALSGCALDELLVGVEDGEDVEDVAAVPLGFVVGYGYWVEEMLDMLLIVIGR